MIKQKKKPVVINAAQERNLADSVQRAYFGRYSKFEDIDPNVVLLSKTGPTAEKKLIQAGYVSPDSNPKLTREGIKLGIKDFKERTGRDLRQEFDLKKDQRLLELKEIKETEKRFKELFKGIKIKNGKKKISVNVILNKHWGRLTEVHLIEIAEQLKK